MKKQIKARFNSKCAEKKHTCIDADVSAKYNISRYGNAGMMIHSDSGKVVFIALLSNDDFTNWLTAVEWAESRTSLIRDKKTNYSII